MLEEYEEAFGKKCPTITQEVSVCLHNMIKDDNGLSVCKDCGFEIEVVDYEPEWRYYSEDASNRDPVRCHSAYPNNQKSLDKIFEKYNIKLPESIKSQVELRYKRVVGKETHRGKGREGIVAACLFRVYMNMGEPKSNEHIRGMFKIDKKRMTWGLECYLKVFPEERTQVMKASGLVMVTLQKTNIDVKYHNAIKDFTDNIDGKTVHLQRSCPQAIAAACVLYYITQIENQEVPRAKFSQKVGLSEITISRLYKSIHSIKDNFVVKDGKTMIIAKRT